MKKVGIRSLSSEEWQLEGNLVLKKGKVYILKDKELRVEIIQLHYDILVAGYRGKWKTTELVTRNYWWPGVTRNVGRYVEECDICQRMKNRTEILIGKLKLSEVPERPQIYLIVDLITKLPLVAGNDAIKAESSRL